MSMLSQHPMYQDAKRMLKEFRALAVTAAILLALAIIAYYVSRPTPEVLYEAASRLKAVQDSSHDGGDEMRIMEALMGHVRAMDTHLYWSAILVHISQALLISVILIVGVDLHTRRAARRDLDQKIQEVVESVFHGVGKRLLGDKIATELDNVLHQDVAKEECGYILKFTKGDGDLGADKILVRVQNWFKLRNLTGQVAKFEVGATFFPSPQEAAEMQEPRYTSVTIRGQEQVPAATSPKMKSTAVWDVLLADNPQDRVDVSLAFEKTYRTRDTETFISLTPVECLRVIVQNEAPDLVGKVEMNLLHPHQRKVACPSPGVWEFNRALLPGQGFYLQWMPPDNG